MNLFIYWKRGGLGETPGWESADAGKRQLRSGVSIFSILSIFSIFWSRRLVGRKESVFSQSSRNFHTAGRRYLKWEEHSLIQEVSRKKSVRSLSHSLEKIFNIWATCRHGREVSQSKCSQSFSQSVSQWEGRSLIQEVSWNESVRRY